MGQEIEMRSVSDLQEHPEAHLVPECSPVEFEELRGSIEEHGVREPLRVTQCGTVLDGRHRLRIARGFQFESVPCLVIDVPEEQQVSYMVEAATIRRNLSKSQLAAIAVDLAAFEEERQAARARLLAGASRGGKTLARVPGGGAPAGSEVLSRDMLGARVGVSGRLIQDALKVKREAPVLHEQIKTGQITLGEARREIRRRERQKMPVVAPPAPRSPRLIVGDATDLYMIEDNSVDLVVTSPPFNLGIEQGRIDSRLAHKMGDSPVRSGIAFKGAEYEERLPLAEYKAFLLKAAAEMFRVLKPGGSAFIHLKVRTVDNEAVHPVLLFAESEFTLRQEIVVDRESTHNNNALLFAPIDERLLWVVKGRVPRLPDRPISFPTVWRCPQRGPRSWHPCPILTEVVQRCLEAVGTPGSVILDPFAGSCVVPRVALEMGFEAIGVEICEDYVERAASEHGWKAGIS